MAPHSLRKFTITDAIKQGLPDTVIVQLARWKSFNSIRPYINLEALDLLNTRVNLTNNVSFANSQSRFRLFCTKPSKV